jgi:prepilin peptidase CpaA
VIHWQLAVAVVIGLVAAIEDIARRRISNWIPITAFVAGLCCLTLNRGWRGALSALGGAVAGFLVFLVFYCLGGMGGGDVKLMAGLGAVVGIERILPAALWTAACGGILAAICVGIPAVRSIWTRTPSRTDRVDSIPYAPAIAVGMWLALVPVV